MEQVKKLEADFQDDEIRCTRCGSINFVKAGTRGDKQRYRCKDCNKQFTEIGKEVIHSRYVISQNISPQEMKLLDVWDLRVLGKNPTAKGRYSINYIEIYPDWFKQSVKDYIWSRVPIRSTGAIIGYVGQLKKISRFAKDNNIFLQPKKFDRNFIIDLINYINSSGLSPKTIGHHLSTWKDFFDFCQRDNILPASSGKLIFDDDYPKRKKSQVKDIPAHVLKQLTDKTSLLAQPISLIIEILMETGLRINEISRLQLNCIQQDSDGDWWLFCPRSKVNKDDRLFVSRELANKITEHHKFIKSTLSNFDKLFCSTQKSGWFEQYGTKYQECKRQELDYFIPVAKPISQSVIRGYLKQLAHEHRITDISGEIYPIWKCHRFRHTHLTDLARKGTGIAHIMQRAGHASPQMAMQYIHLTDDDQKKKMKEVWDNTHFNMEGEIVAPVNPDLDTAEMQWIKKGMGMQTTDNGYCTLLWTQTCPHQDLPCKSCGSWITTLDFLDSHKKELEETERIIENARQKGYPRQIEKNVPRAERLKKIISGMEKHQTMRGLGHN